MDADTLVARLRGTLPDEQLHDLIERLRTPREPLAVVGLACRFPGRASSPEALWELVRDGGDAVREVPRERWDVEAYYDPTPGAPGKMSTRFGAFLDDFAAFDPAFFGIAEVDAPYLDPQQRLALEVSWEALEDAGQPRERLAGRAVGVFLGWFTNDYHGLQHADGISCHPSAATGTQPSMAAGRIAHWLDLRGPALVVDTACSSSLVAIHLACQSLWDGESELALAGGVQLYLTPREHVMTSRLGMVSPDGRCKTFDASANGIVQGEGCGMVVLKRLRDAQRDDDRVLAVVRGSAINHDGRTLGLTAPSADAQRRVLGAALRCAGVAPTSVGYLELHGTGTPIGDPVEFDALSAVYGGDRAEPCALGSIKANIGHAAAAAGVAGFMRALLAIRHATIPGNPHLRKLNPRIALAESGFTMSREATAWRADEPRRAGVSAFGASGTNAHVVLEEARETARTEAPGPGPWLLVLSAPSEPALARRLETFADFLRTTPTGSFAAVCATAALRRSHHAHRVALVARDALAAAALLNQQLLTGTAVACGRARSGAGRAAIDDSLSALALAFCAGAVIDFEALMPRCEVVSLPAHPWQHANYWAVAREPADQAVEHSSLVEAEQVAGARMLQLDKRVHPWLDQHRLLGRAVVPAAALLEAALSSGRALADVSFEALLEVDGAQAQLRLTAGDTFQIEASEGTVHTRGRLLASEPIAAFDVFAVRAGCAAASPEALYRALHEGGGVQYGAAFQAIRELYVAPRRALARIALDPEAGLGTGRYQIHPALLDACLHTIAAALPSNEATHAEEWVLPRGVARVRLARRAPHAVWCLVELSELRDDMLTATVRIVDELGNAIAQLDDFQASRHRTDPDLGLALRPVWISRPLPSEQVAPGRWLTWGEPALFAALADRMGAGFEPVAVEGAALLRALDEGARGVLCALPPRGSDPAADIAAFLESLRDLLKQLADRPAALWLVEPGCGTGVSLSGVLMATVASLRAEHPGLRLRVIEAREVSALVAELSAPEAAWAEPRVRWVGREREVLRLEPTASLPTPQLLRRDASYLVAGGLGELGLAAAEVLVEAGAGTVWLCGRRAASPRADQLIAGLRARGGDVRTLCADLGTPPGVDHVMGALRGQPPLRGVVHAAGVLDDHAFVATGRSQIDALLAPKIGAAWSLHHATRDSELDFFVVFSSAGSHFEAPGQVVYAAANGALDALVEERVRLGSPATALQWGPWAELGMASRHGVLDALARFGLRGLSTVRGKRLLRRLLGASGVWTLADLERAQIAVADPLWSAFAGAALPAYRAEVLAAPASRREGMTLDVLRRLLAQTLAIAESQIDDDEPLDSFGLSSLTAVSFRAAIERAFGVRLPTTIAWSQPHLRALAHTVHERMCPADSAREDACPDEEAALRGLEASDIHSLLERELAAAEDVIGAGSDPA